MTIPVIKVGIVTASDRSFRGERKDASGPLLQSLIENDLGFEVIAYRVVPDEQELIRKAIIHMADLFFCDLIFTTGGTGLSPRDVTPDVTKQLISREVPGISEAIRAHSMKKTKMAMLSRGISGIRGKSFVINLPGIPEAIRESFELLKDILPHAVQLIQGKVRDCQQSHSPLQHSHS